MYTPIKSWSLQYNNNNHKDMGSNNDNTTATTNVKTTNQPPCSFDKKHNKHKCNNNYSTPMIVRSSYEKLVVIGQTTMTITFNYNNKCIKNGNYPGSIKSYK